MGYMLGLCRAGAYKGALQITALVPEVLGGVDGYNHDCHCIAIVNHLQCFRH
jgi:hypothetical protein